MKPIPRSIIGLLLMLGSIVPGCGRGHDRQMIYTAPRVSPVRVDTRGGVRVRAPFVDVEVPATKPVPPSNGVDVPIVEPD